MSILVALATFGLVTFFIFSGARAQPVSCRFDLEARNAPLRLPRTVLVHGTLTGSSKRMADVDGFASWQQDGKQISLPISGWVFQAGDGATSGLFLGIDDVKYGSNAFSVATLSNSGQLDQNRSEAFLYQRGQADKRAYPMRYSCTDRVS
jgi:hypothetical protein